MDREAGNSIPWIAQVPIYISNEHIKNFPAIFFKFEIKCKKFDIIIRFILILSFGFFFISVSTKLRYYKYVLKYTMYCVKLLTIFTHM